MKYCRRSCVAIGFSPYVSEASKFKVWWKISLRGLITRYRYKEITEIFGYERLTLIGFEQLPVSKLKCYLTRKKARP